MKFYKKISSKGFSHLEVFLVIIVLIAIVGTYLIVRPHALSTSQGILPPDNVQVDANVPGSIYISWDSSVSPGVTEYEVLRNNVNIATTSNTYLIDTSIQPGTQYQYSIEAISSANVASEPSLPLYVTSQFSLSPETPNITGSTSSFSASAQTTNNENISANSTNTGKKVVTSTNWSGYAVLASNVDFTQIVATVQVPDVTTCKVDGSTVGLWVGMGGLNVSGLEQDGIAQQCNKNNHGNLVSSYWAWTEMIPADQVIIPLAVHPGQEITVQTSVATDGKFVFYLKNDTTQKKFTSSYYCASGVNCTADSGEWIIERKEDCLNTACTKTALSALSDYSTTVVKNASLAFNYDKGHPLGYYPNNAINMLGSNKKTQLNATAHPLSDTATSFSSKWLNSQ